MVVFGDVKYRNIKMFPLYLMLDYFPQYLDGCSNKVWVNVNISSTASSNIKKGPVLLPGDEDVVDLVGVGSVGQLPR